MALVNITKRVRIDGKGWRFCEVVFGGNRKIRPNAVLIDGKEQVHPEGRYYIDFLQDGQRKRLAAGATAAEATIAADQQTRTLTARRAAADAGITLPQSKPAAGSRLLQEAVETYLLEIQAHKKKKTHSAYRTALTYFLESCKKQTLEEIHRADMLAFKTYLRDKKKQSDRSIANKFENVMSFLKQQKITGLIGKNDRPTFTEEEVETYTQDELDKFFAACTETENMWFEFFYRTAMREQEVMHVRGATSTSNGRPLQSGRTSDSNGNQRHTRGGPSRSLRACSHCSKRGRRSLIRRAGWSSQQQAANPSRIFWTSAKRLPSVQN